MPDNTNIPQSLPLTLIRLTDRVIHFGWEPLAEDDPHNPIVYQVWITEEENPADPWRMVRESTGMCVFVFNDLKSDTGYGIKVKAFKGSTLVCQYPAYKGCLTVRTKAPDHEAPTVTNRALQLISSSYYTLSIKWEPATDKATKKEKIRYCVWIKPCEAPDNAWQKVEDRKGISSFTFENLDINTWYAYYVEAFDEAGNCLRYPKDNGYSTGSTAADKTAPTVNDKTIQVTGTTKDSISIQWEPATDDVTPQDKIRYQMWRRATDESSWSMVDEIRGISSYTFKNLKEATNYYIYVRAYDDAANYLQYPGTTSTSGPLTVSTLAPDKTAPTVKNRNITVTDVAKNSISVEWEPATDNVTKQENIRYEVWLLQTNPASGSWKKVENKKGISSYTFKNLLQETGYSIQVRAYDEAGNSFAYPSDNSGMSVRTLDKTAPTVKDRTLKVTQTTSNSISIQWTPPTDNVTPQYQIGYEMWICGPGETWRKADERKGVSSYTFKNLKEATKYSFYVIALDDAHNSLRYPSNNGTASASTLDITAPTVYDRKLEIENIRDTCFTARWYLASDQVTPTGQIRYEVYLREGGNWKLKASTYAIDHFTFTGLTPNTEYAVYVKAIDAAGNSITYPGEGKNVSVRTVVKQISKLNITIYQNAKYLPLTDCIRLTLSYNAVRYNSSGVLVESKPGSWERKWSSGNTATKVITLDPGWTFEINQVHIYIDSRKAASAGLNKWEKCSEGYVDLTSEYLNLKLTGSYYSHTVQFTVL